MSSDAKARKIPFLDLARIHAELSSDIDAAIASVRAHGQFINGPDVKAFEKAWAAFCGVPHAIGAANGTAALHAILACLGVGPGDEVILPSHTFIATAESIRFTGARPVFAECREDTMLLDVDHVRALITPRTRAIVPVQLYGMPCAMDEINALACANNLPVVEDASQGHGGRLNGRTAGGLGLAAAFSFFPGKNLGAFGDAGGITTIDADLARKMALYVIHGRESKYEHLMMGTNYRLDTLQAAILSVKLPRLAEWNARRTELAKLYRARFGAAEFAELGVRLQADTPGADSAWHHFVIRVADRDALAADLQKRGVPSGIHYPIPCHAQPSMADVHPGALPVTERVAREILSLPICPTLSDEEAHRIVDAVAASLRGEAVRAA
jgi:dTDP-4-amino-4,6-dideoxygalactose transaminase